MRLWHWRLIPVLPRQQLLGQWRECCLIAKNIAENGTPNHVLVNPVIDYDVDEFLEYCKLVVNEMNKRGYKANIYDIFEKMKMDIPLYWNFAGVENLEFFHGWHNDQYFWQCYYNLQEKHDRGEITDDEWNLIEKASRLVPSA